MDRVAILVAGMHRSGTSALTRMLGSLGCDLPGTLMAPNEYNERGYWESEPVSALNDALLESAGSAWDDWEPFNPAWYASPVAAGFRDGACAVLEQEFQDSRMFVLKDPRVARLLPFWLEVLADFGADTRVAVPVRNPVEVVRSLQVRDVIDPSVGHLLWLRHVLDAEAGSRDRRRAFVRFEDLLHDWPKVADTMAHELQLSWPRQSTAARMEIEERLDSSERHQVAEDAAVLESGQVSAWVSSTFEIVDRWAHGNVDKSDRASLDAIRSAFDEAGPAFARAVVTGMRAGQRSRGLEEEVAALREVVSDREAQIDSLNRAVGDRDENVAYLHGLVQEKDQELDRIGTTLADRDRELDALQHVVAARDGEISALREAAAAREDRLGELGRRVSDRDRQIDALEHQVAVRDGEITALKEAVAERDDRIGVLDKALQGAAEEREALRRTAEDRQREVDAMHTLMDDRDRELAAVYASISWHVTKPMRLLKKVLRDSGQAMSRGLVETARVSLRVGWRLLPLFPSTRARLKRTALGSFAFLGPLARSAPRPRTPPKYTPSGWLDLADLSYEARRNGTELPILFDPDWYLATYPDIRVAGVNPLSHYLRHGAVEGRWPVELEPSEIDPAIELLHRLDLTTEEAHSFDGEFSRTLYPELAKLNDSELALVCTGDGERIGSRAAFVAELCGDPREIPLDFDAGEYIRLYPDLRYLADQSPLEALRHYMCHGRFEPRLHTLRVDPAETRSENEAAGDPTMPETDSARQLCVLVHVFYPELWDELSRYIDNLPVDGYDLYVNLVEDTFDTGLLRRVRDAFPDARVYVSENVGRDIGGYFRLLDSLRIEDYPLFCLLHTKKSPHMAQGEVQRWRRRLLEPVLGTRECAADNIRTMLEDETVGIVGSAHCRYTEMDANREKYDTLLEALHISESSDEVEFLSGTMMLLRGDVLRRVFDAAHGVAFERSDEVTVEGDPDGAWAHAVERVFGAVVRDSGYRIEWR